MPDLHIWNGQEDDPDWLDSFTEDVDRDVSTLQEVGLVLFLIVLVVLAMMLHS